jgi:hypothetical protein
LELIERYKDCVDFINILRRRRRRRRGIIILLIQAVRTRGEELVAALLDAGAESRGQELQAYAPSLGNSVMDTI